MTLRSFARHRGAVVGLVVLVTIVVLAVSALGVGPVPGWWPLDYRVPMPIVDGGRPTLSAWPPSLGPHPFGQDNLGRDYFALTLQGARQSLVIALVVGLVGTVLGAVAGACAGYYRGAVEAVLMRLTDVLLTIPLIAVAAVVAGHGRGLGGVWGLGLFLGLVTWPPLARLVRSEVLTLREREFVDAARTLGATDARILRRHVLPNAAGVIIVSATLAVSSAILLESALSYLGFGVQPPGTSLGQLINDYRSAMTVRPWLFWWPGLFIVAIALSVNLLGDGLRDALDPRQLRGARRGASARSPDAPVPAEPAPAAPGPSPVLEVRDLGVEFAVDGAWVPAVRDVGFAIAPGEVLALVGGSGAGKSASALAILGLLPASARSTGSVRLAGAELLGAPAAALRAVRGTAVGVVFQEPATALNPVLTVGSQVAGVLLAHRTTSPARARARTLELFALVRLPTPAATFGAYPHQLSGGQRQRVMIAMAIACDPVLLIADEPTSALDIVTAAQVLDLLRELPGRLGLAILLITHDLGVVADLADRVVVLDRGRVVESGPVRQVLVAPAHPRTRALVDAVPVLVSVLGRAPAAGPAQAPGAAALEVRDVVVDYPGRRRTPPVRAVDGVSFVLAPGEILGLVGESGAGKSTLGRAVVGLAPLSGGSIAVAGAAVRDRGAHSRGAHSRPGVHNQPGARRARPPRPRAAIVFQDPGTSLDPRLTVGASIGEPLRLHDRLGGVGLDRRVDALLDDVGLPRAYRTRFPHELSGGERQRVAIARALSLSPDLVVADEPTSALDVVAAAQVLDLLRALQRARGFACLFISHDLAVVERVASRVAVLRRGRLVEIGPCSDVLTSPRAEYTRALIAATRVPDPDAQRARRAARARLPAAEDL
ncbi:ABC transporter ATP-binding protein/permease [Pengzhenrongella sicca]|uniref:ATP-binding cassette domain-containing protein n=1 Tax=Pengzhenrongella sicca TaxID=2819238 RepID=A0A8A4ZCS8_9MICO|nr:ATP-binding cassette domain-containing protein [Pengzhenrongella sicca]QTE28829.1 ATP-binding cassette domain-containing protein [Pengzhenrongella sicca]